MDIDLRRLFHRTLDHAVAYREGLPEGSARPGDDYRTMRERMRSPLPETAEKPEVVIDELVALCSAGLMPIAGPRFFGWVMGASHPVGVAADWLVSAWGQNAGYHTPTPAVSAMEEIAENWLLEILNLPRDCRIGFATCATVANTVCLAAARTRVLRDVGWDPDVDGLFGAPPVHVFIGADAHSSLFSSLQMIGFGSGRLTRIETDAEGRMRPEKLKAPVAECEGPKVIVAQAGQINTGAFDPFPQIADIASATGAWLHVDGAFGLWARAAPDLARITEGIERADSWATDGHKWLQVPYDCGFAIVRDTESHQRAMTQWSSYLPMIGKDDRVPSAYVPELSRRARGVPVWAILKALGRQGVAEMVSRHCALARRMGERLAKEPGVHIRNDVVLNQVAISFGAGDAPSRKAATEAVIAEVQAGGICYVGGADWHGEWIMRISVTSGETTESDIDRSADAIIAAWRTVQGS